MQDTRYRDKGTTDGTFRGHHYFECAENAGLFVSLDQVYQDIQQHPRGAVASTESSRKENGGSKNNDNDKLSTERGVREDNPDAAISQSSEKSKRSDFKLGQRVKFLDKMGTQRYGAVRWTGKNDRHEFTVVGIECVSCCCYG